MAVVGLMGVALSAAAKEPNKDQPGKKPGVKDQAAEKTAPAAKTKAVPAPSGRELFTREWLPNDSRAHGGDGLGPVFNDSSCVACHNQGGIGGGGAASKNVDIISSTFALTAAPQAFEPQTLPEALFHSLFGGLAPHPPAPGEGHPLTADEIKAQQKQFKEALVKVHPGFASAKSVVLHHFGIDPKYQEFRGTFLGTAGGGINQVSAGIGPTSATVQVAEAPAANAQPQEQPEQPQAAEAPAQPEPADENPTPQTETEPPSALVQAINELSGNTPEFEVPATPGLAEIPEIAQLQTEVMMRNNQGSIPLGNGLVQIDRSQRNATALFGVGQIDSIPEKALLKLAKREQKEYPDVAGRPSKQKDGKIGRFGWKAQKPSLEDFTLTACAVELGLNVPGHEQAGLAMKPDYKAPGLDMNKAECDALVKFLRDLPTPAQRKSATAQETTMFAAGRKQFAAIGCTNCHVQKVGAVDGIYSDLLLHDMGPELGDTGNYGIFTPNSPEEEQDDPLLLADENPGTNVLLSSIRPQQPQKAKLTPEQLAKVVGAMRQEWRTPPLWGVRDSGPYLHDGRADTLEQAVAFHGGQGTTSAIKFFKLKPEERQQVIAFLKSLTAPDQALVAAK